MVWNDIAKRMIPEGWRMIPLGSLIKENKRPFSFESAVPNLDLSVMPENNISLMDANSSDDFETNLFEMREGDILFGSIRPYLKKAGIAPLNGSHAGTVLNFSPIKDEYFNFVLFTICNDNFFNYCIKRSRGTKMPIIGSSDVLEFQVPFNEKLVKKFGAIDIKKTMIANIKEAFLLKTLREELLPLLMNGQAKVS